MPIITLTTDLGLSDGYVGAMKGVILSIAPDAQLVDISHQIAPQDIRQAAYVLHDAAGYFPAGAIHVAVVDPGVGSVRRALVLRTSQAFFVGPDNGVFTLFLADAPDAECYALENPAFMLSRVSATFHGRDVFAPAAAHLARGVPPADFGPRVYDPVTFAVPRPVEQTGGRWLAHVLYADHFGNLITSLTRDTLDGATSAEISIGPRRITRRILRIVRTYADAAPGELVALFGSSNHLEISVVNGNAAQTLGLGPDAPLTLGKKQDA